MRILRTSSIQPLKIQRFFVQRYFSLQTMAVKLEQVYQSHIPLEERYCLEELKKEWIAQKPLKDKRILLNSHITMATLPMIALLLATEAHVTVAVSPLLTQHHAIRQILTQTGVPVLDAIAELPKEDIIYDCGAGMRELNPSIGMVELTQTDPKLYKNIAVPIITVDQSFTKQLESIGTGESLIRVLNHLIQQELIQHGFNQKPSYSVIQHLLATSDLTQFYAKQRWLVFGFGKVGGGLTEALRNVGVPSRHITVVETSWTAYLQALRNSYQAFFLDETDDQTIQQIKDSLPQYFAVITATGVPGFMSKFFSEKDFPKQLLINYGTLNEFGEKFAAHRVVNQNYPANFMLKFPTRMCYLDAIFVLFLKAGVELLNRPLSKGFYSVSSELDTHVLRQWLKHYGDKIWHFPKKPADVNPSYRLNDAIMPTL